MGHWHERVELSGAVEAVHGVTHTHPQLVQARRDGLLHYFVGVAAVGAVPLPDPHSLPGEGLGMGDPGQRSPHRGREVTSTAGCHGGDEGGEAGCGGTGQPARATWPDELGTVVVVGCGRATGCAGLCLDRGEASTGRSGSEGAEVVTGPEPVEAAAGVDVEPRVVTAAMAVTPSATDSAAQERVTRPDESTVHCRGPSVPALGSSTRRLGVASQQPIKTQVQFIDPGWVFGLWKSRRPERILIMWDPRGFRREARMGCTKEDPS